MKADIHSNPYTTFILETLEVLELPPPSEEQGSLLELMLRLFVLEQHRQLLASQSQEIVWPHHILSSEEILP